jgi:hypothetical protein
MKMKTTKRQLRKIIKEERQKLVREQDGDLIGDIPSDLEENVAMAMQELFEELIASESYEGTGPTWEQEISTAGFEYYQAIIDSGAAKMMLELFADVEERLHNGDYA